MPNIFLLSNSKYSVKHTYEKKWKQIYNIQFRIQLKNRIERVNLNSTLMLSLPIYEITGLASNRSCDTENMIIQIIQDAEWSIFIGPKKVLNDKFNEILHTEIRPKIGL